MNTSSDEKRLRITTSCGAHIFFETDDTKTPIEVVPGDSIAMTIHNETLRFDYVDEF